MAKFKINSRYKPVGDNPADIKSPAEEPRKGRPKHVMALQNAKDYSEKKAVL